MLIKVVFIFLLAIHVSESSLGWLAPCFSSLLEFGGLQFKNDQNGETAKERSSSVDQPVALPSEQKVSRLKAPLLNKSKSGTQRRIATASKDVVHFYLYPDPMY